MLNSVGESKHPCLTSTIVRNQSPVLPLKSPALVALSYKFLMMVMRLAPMLYLCMVVQNAVCKTLSRAFLKSIKTWYKYCWCCWYFSISTLRLKICSLALLSTCETWTITADIERRIQALEMRCFRKFLGISYRDHITNEEVKARIGNAIGPYENLLTTVKRRKLKWYGHVTRSSGLAKTILQGTVQGGRRRGRQRKRWEDNIKEWTGLPWNITLRKAEDREQWRKLVVKSTVVPQRSANGQPDYGIDKIR